MAYKKLTEAVDGGWVVFGLGAQAPSVVHDTALSAHQEAVRLARKNPGKKFFTAQVNSSAGMRMEERFMEHPAEKPTEEPHGGDCGCVSCCSEDWGLGWSECPISCPGCTHCS